MEIKEIVMKNASFRKATYYLSFLDGSNVAKEKFGWDMGMSYNFLLKW